MSQCLDLLLFELLEAILLQPDPAGVGLDFVDTFVFELGETHIQLGVFRIVLTFLPSVTPVVQLFQLIGYILVGKVLIDLVDSELVSNDVGLVLIYVSHICSICITVLLSLLGFFLVHVGALSYFWGLKQLEVPFFVDNGVHFLDGLLAEFEAAQ